MRSTGNSTRGCLPLLETDNSVFGQRGVAEHWDRVVNNHHVLLILGHGPALVVQSALKNTSNFLWSGQYCKRRHQGRHNLGHIPALRFPRLIPAGKVYDYSLSRVLQPRAGRCIEALIHSDGGQKPRVIVTASHSSSCSIYVNINNFKRESMDE